MWEIFYNNTVTLFNRTLDDDGNEKWFSTLLQKVNLVTVASTSISKAGTSEANTAKLFVMKEKYSDKSYLSPKKWQALDDTEKANYFTFQPAEYDFFIEGDYTSVTSSNNLFEYMKSASDNIYKITSVEDYADILPHFEIGGV